MALWLKANSPSSDVVISTRARLARNLRGTPFPCKLRRAEDAQKVMDAAKGAFLRPGMDLRLEHMADISPVLRERYIEQRIISRDLAANPNGALIISPDEAVSVMLMEEDHYRLQCIKSGMDVDGSL
ncbi:MAG: ATP--guanido phosphotransferase, partial [Christensenellaceae bacterium]|nr:ATP--guanido phosphotransferase [Christensenellaceae bacterium]